MSPHSMAWILFPLIILHLISLTVSQPTFDSYTCINSKGNYNSTSTYRRNLVKLLSIMASETQPYGFYNLSVGQNSDKVYGIALCRSDFSAAECHQCVNQAAQKLIQLCPVEKEAIGYYNECLLRYSDKKLFGIMEISPNYTTQSSSYAPDVEKLKETLSGLFERLIKEATSGFSYNYKFATGNANVTASLKIYALTLCSPDLSPSDCSECLRGAVNAIPECCGGKLGAIVKRPSCSIEFEDFPYYSSDNIALPNAMQPSSNVKSKPGKLSKKYKVSIIIVLSLVFVVILTTVVICCFSRRRRRRRDQKNQFKAKDQISGINSLKFDFNTIRDATENFSDARTLQQDSYAVVYKGVLPSGQDIVVKRLSNICRDTELQLNKEVMLLANLQHRNLVKLLGFCIENDKGMFLIYEFLPNDRLDQFIYDPIKRASLDWETRNKIILGTARGLLYLHEDSHLRVLHGDVKASNILLDVAMNPKISNFSMARLVQVHEPSGDTNTANIGTFQYSLPDHVGHEQYFTIESDVLSFGVLLLEIISGQNKEEFSGGETQDSLPNFAWRKWLDGTVLDVVDPSIPSIESHIPQILRCIKIALLCVLENASCRPSMSTVSLLLNSSSISIADPSRPAMFT